MIALPTVKVWNRHKFENQDISEQFQYAISICEYDEMGEELRPDYKGHRLNLWFYDSLDGHGAATADDIGRLYEFSKKWVEAANADPFLARLVVHCFAGISRSSACAMMPLSLYYGSYLGAARHLFKDNLWIHPNSYILGLVSDYICYQENIWESVGRCCTLGNPYQ